MNRTRMENQGTIEECGSAWAAPVVLVPKPGGGTSICVDYRKLNQATKPDMYPLPRINDLLHAARGTSFMSTMDLRAGYWQIPVRPQDRDKTTFISSWGLHRFTRMPFGLRNVPATFQRFMDRFRSGLGHVRLLSYLDDMILLYDSFETHLEDLRCIFTKLRQYRFCLNRPKCRFCGDSISI